MSLSRKFLFLFFLFSITPALSLAGSLIHHDIKVKLNPAGHSIDVSDELTLPVEMQDGSGIVFYLHESLKLDAGQNKIQSIPQTVRFPAPVKAYRLSLEKGESKVILRYSGAVHHQLKSQGQEYARNFSETAGMISDDGVFLAGSSIWYPYIESSKVSFSMQVETPAGWKVVSQGERLSLADTSVQWQELNPQEEIYLIAAPFYEYSKTVGKVEAMAFLRKEDAGLANKYLEVTADYIEMYRQLLGPYPYSKFALVENFWETGYGMPSFTLLGPRVIRMPFILHSSYPHEILHNWWGNGVYVDYQQGNWAEGLTSYLADHLIQEQRGKAVNFRRSILQNYADFVSAGRDFPLAEFTSRHSSSSEAIGYGKSQMFFHMLRQQLGDEAFVLGLKRFYRQYQFDEAGFADLLKVFKTVGDSDLTSFFQQWVERTGAPALQLDVVTAVQDKDGWLLRGVIKQVQAGDAYQLNVTVAVSLEGKDKPYQSELVLADKQQAFSIRLAAKPLRLDVDPEFDLFRRVSRAEIPPALSQAFGAEQVLLVLPSKASAAARLAYEALAKSWSSSQFGNLEVKYDNEMEKLPNDRSVWLLGGQNRFADKVISALKAQGISHKDQTILLNEGEFKPAQHSIVLTARGHSDDQHAMVWLAADRPEAIPGLARKLPHYRKYSYLVFDGDEPTNIVKGQWPVLDSPMSVALAEQATKMASLRPRSALAQLPAVFNQQRMMNDVRALAAAEMQGRGLGSEGLEKAAQYIATAFRKAGLRPGFPESDSFVQQWSEPVEGLGGDVKMKNIVGYIPGTNPAMAGQSVVIGAHYDHLGLGWPDVREGNKGKLHSGADDNASGIAVMLELARIAAQGWQPQRSIVFVAFTAEEAGRLGSRYFVRNYQYLAADKTIAMVNLDTVGRLGDAPVTAFGTGSASEWLHIFRGIGFVTGLKVKGVAKEFGSSDQRSYLDIGVPAVQLFATIHEDFHRPGDTVDKVDAAGLVKVATVLKETVEYLSARPEPLNASLAGASTNPPEVRQGRKVSLGTVPDFSFAGPGVKLTGVVPDSPVEKAGLAAGDVIISVNQQPVADLRDFAQQLRTMIAGQSVSLTYVRQGKEQQVQLKLLAR